MIILLFILSIITVIVGFYLDDHNYCNSIGAFFGIFGVIGVLFFGVILFILAAGFPYGVDQSIEMYENENAKIEEKVRQTVEVYLEHEQNTYKSLNENTDLTTLLVAYPELNSNTLVQQEMQIYVDNNNKIKELKEKRIHRHVYAWWLYFGK